MTEPFVVEKSRKPLVLSKHRESPASQYLVEREPSSLEEMYELKILPQSVDIEHLREAQELAQQIAVPDVMFVGNNGVPVSDEPITGGARSNTRASAVMLRTVELTAEVLERHGHPAREAEFIAKKAVYFVSPVSVHAPPWSYLDMTSKDLDVRGTLYVARGIQSIWANNVVFHEYGWIVAEGVHFQLVCNSISGRNDGAMQDVMKKVRESIAGIDPGGPIEGWSDRPPIDQIHEQAAAIMSRWT